MNELFSTYRQGENRVTATLLAVLQNLSVHHFAQILQGLTGLEDRPLITIRNQSKTATTGEKNGSREKSSVPDAELSANFDIRLETKLGTSSGNTEQVRLHAAQVREGARHRFVVVLGKAASDVPDEEVSEDRLNVIEKSFAALLKILDDVVLQDPFSSERERYLVHQFSAFINSEGLIEVFPAWRVGTKERRGA